MTSKDLEPSGPKGLIRFAVDPAPIVTAKIPSWERDDAMERGRRLGVEIGDPIAMRHGVDMELRNLLARHGINPDGHIMGQYESFDCIWTVTGYGLAKKTTQPPEKP